MKMLINAQSLRLFSAIVIFLSFLISCNDDNEIPAPEITGLNPTSAMPATIVSITGKGFSTVFNDNTVTFNGKAALVTNSSPTQLNVVVPIDAETGPVSVKINGVAAINQPVFTVVPLPTEVHTMNPYAGGYNTVVNFTGKNFRADLAGNTVTFNGHLARVESVTATTLTVKVPLRAGTGPVVVNGLTTGNFKYQADVYIAGHLYDASGYARATYWKNGSPVTLSTVGFNTYAYDIKVVNDDVYVVGDRHTGTYNVARLWKNGTEIPLTNESTSSHAAEVLIAGEDVYVVGYEFSGKQVAVYWKNGSAVKLTDASTYAIASSIVIIGNDVYVGGNSTHSNGNTVATYWKNGTAHVISDKTTFAHGIFVSGNDIYLTGSERNTGPGVGFPTYWKNGSTTYLGPGLGGAAGYDIMVTENDVYVAGVEDNALAVRLAKYWKNGFPVVLSDGSRPAFANAIDVVGDEVYVVGHEYNGANKAVVKLWKDDAPTSITDGGYFAGAEGVYVR
jgi:hypothetical protein